MVWPNEWCMKINPIWKTSHCSFNLHPPDFSDGNLIILKLPLIHHGPFYLALAKSTAHRIPPEMVIGAINCHDEPRGAWLPWFDRIEKEPSHELTNSKFLVSHIIIILPTSMLRACQFTAWKWHKNPVTLVSSLWIYQILVFVWKMLIAFPCALLVPVIITNLLCWYRRRHHHHHKALSQVLWVSYMNLVMPF